MKKLAGIMGGLFKRPFWRTGHGMRGRVHKISIIAGGEVSIVIRCGLDEPRARQLLQGSLIEFFETRDGIPPRAAVELVSGEPGAVVPLEPHQRPLHAPQLAIVKSDGCTCGAPGGYPHEPDCGYWDAVAGENLYDRESAGYPNRTIWEQLPVETKNYWIDWAITKKKAAEVL